MFTSTLIASVPANVASLYNSQKHKHNDSEALCALSNASAGKHYPHMPIQSASGRVLIATSSNSIASINFSSDQPHIHSRSRSAIRDTTKSSSLRDTIANGASQVENDAHQWVEMDLMETAHVAFTLSDCGRFVAVAQATGRVVFYCADAGKRIKMMQINPMDSEDRIVSLSFEAAFPDQNRDSTKHVFVVTALGSLFLIKLDINHIEGCGSIDDIHSSQQGEISQIATCLGKETATSQLLSLRIASSLYLISANHNDEVAVWSKWEESRESGSVVLARKRASINMQDWAVRQMRLTRDFRFVILWVRNVFQWMDWMSMVPLFDITIDNIVSFAFVDTAGNHEIEDVKQIMLVLHKQENNSPSLEVRSVNYPEGSRNIASTKVLWVRSGLDETEHHLSVFPTFRRDRMSFGLATCQHGKILLAEWTNLQSMNKSSLSSNNIGDNVGSLITELKSLASKYNYEREDSPEMARIIECANKCFDMVGIDDRSTQVLIARLDEFIHYVYTHLEMPTSDARNAPMMDCCARIHAGLHKWTTFQLLSSCFTESGNKRAEWIEFYKSNLYEVLTSYLRCGAMRAVRILWNRHSAEMYAFMTPEILTCIPKSVRVQEYLEWLTQDVLRRLFMPAHSSAGSAVSNRTITSSKLSLQEIYQTAAVWCIERATSIASEDGYDDAILLIEGFLSTLPVQVRAFLDMETHTCSDLIRMEDTFVSSEVYNLAELKEIKSIREQLYHVKYLANDHGYVISFASLAMETPTSIAMSMLDRSTSPRRIRDELKNHVRIYLKKYNKNCDEVLEEYIAEVIETDDGLHGDAEERVIVLLDEIENEEIRMTAALKWFRGMRAPYSNTVQEYARGCSSQETNQKYELQEVVRLMNIQEMLFSYGIGKISITDTKHIPYVISHILGQVDRPSALTDGICLIDASIRLNKHYRTLAIVEYLENLLSVVPADPVIDQETRSSTIITRSQAITETISFVERNSFSVKCIGEIVDEVVSFGLSIIERAEKELEAMEEDMLHHITAGAKMKAQEYVYLVPLMEKIVGTYLEFCQKKNTLEKNMSRKANTQLLRDLQRLQQIESEYGILLSISTLENKGKCEKYIARFIKLREVQMKKTNDTDQKRYASGSLAHLGNGKRKISHHAGTNAESTGIKRQKLFAHDEAQMKRTLENETLVDERIVQISTELRRFALLLGLESHDYDTLIARHAAQNRSIGQAVQYARELFSYFRNRVSYCVSWNGKLSRERGTLLAKNHLLEKAATKLQQLSFLISAHEAHCVNNLQQKTNNQSISALSNSQLGSTLCSMELLTYTACVCEIHSLAECILLYRNAVFVNDILQYATMDTTAIRGNVGCKLQLYTQWFRDDTTVLPYAQGMRLATQYAIQEHKIFKMRQYMTSSGEQDPKEASVGSSIQSVTSNDLLPSKRLVSFLLGQKADLLALRVILSMQILPVEAQVVLQSEKSRLLSTIFQSERIDRFMSLGVMLAMEQCDAFDSFRSQITKENVVKDYTRFQQLAIIGSDAARSWQQFGFLQNCVDLEANARWWHCFSLLGIKCEAKAFLIEKRDIEYLKRLVPELMKKSNLDLLSVLEFTRQYHIDDNFPLLVYVEELLLHPDGKGIDYQSLIVGVLDEIHAHYLQPVLLRTIPSVSGLDYGRLEFIYQLLLDRTSCPDQAEISTRLQVLRLLKLQSETRTKKQLGAINYHSLMMEPYKVLSSNLSEDNFEVMAAIGVLLQVDTDKLIMVLLQNIIESTSIAADEKRRWTFARFEKIISNSSSPSARASAAQWLAEQLTNDTEKLKALNYAVNIFQSTKLSTIKSDDSEEKTLASDMQLAQCKNDVLYHEIKILLQNLGARELESMIPKILEDVRGWINEPKRLFVEVYQRYSVPFRAINQSNMLHRLGDLICAQLGLVNQRLRLQLVQVWLTEDAVRVCKSTWNRPEASIFDPRENEPNIFKVSADEEYDDRDQHFVEEIYSMISWLANREIKVGSDAKSDSSELVEIINYLFNFVKETRARAGVTSRAKLRAAKILLLCTNIWSKQITLHSDKLPAGKNIDVLLIELKTYLRHGRYMIVLEEHRVPIDLPSFIKMDKVIIVESLLRRSEKNGDIPVWALKCASQVMLEFDIDNISLWYRILKLLTEKKMFKHLLSFLVALSGKPIVRTLSDGYIFWEATLHSPLKSLISMCKDGILEDQIDLGSAGEGTPVSVNSRGIPLIRVQQVLEDMVLLLRTCPFLERIDVPKIIVLVRDIGELLSRNKSLGQHTLAKKLKLNTIAVRIAMMIPKPQTRYEALVQIIKAGAYQSVLDEMVDTAAISDEDHPNADMGTLGSNAGMFQEQLALLHVIFTEAVTQGYHQAILTTSFKQSFLEFIASTHDIEHTLSLLLYAKEFDSALHLVEMHNEQQPENKTEEANRNQDDFTCDIEANSDTSKAVVSKWQPLLDFVSKSKSSNLLACLETLIKEIQPTLLS